MKNENHIIGVFFQTGKPGKVLSPQPNNDLKLMQGLSMASLKHHVALQVVAVVGKRKLRWQREFWQSEMGLGFFRLLRVGWGPDQVFIIIFLSQPLAVIMAAGIIFVGAYCGRSNYYRRHYCQNYLNLTKDETD